MNNDNRNYCKWIKILTTDKSWIIRHDIDFDIGMARHMLNAERNMEVKSITYVDVHSPSYTINDILNLYNEFHNDGFMFGLHINTAYDNDKDDAIKQYKEDIELLRNNNINVHSCVGHLYSVNRIPVPEFSNLTIELNAKDYSDVPSFWDAFCLGRNSCCRIIDSACYLHSSYGPIGNLDGIITTSTMSSIGYI